MSGSEYDGPAELSDEGLGTMNFAHLKDYSEKNENWWK